MLFPGGLHFTNTTEIINFAKNTSDTINYITSPEGLTAIQISHITGGQEWYWVFTDHLGSISTLLCESDGQKFEMSYDACKVKLGFCECSETKTLVEPISYEARGREGNRRDPATWNNYTTTLPGFVIDRGYTGHEHLDVFGLINMNGRVYDPVIARFLSPGPYIQSPDVPQNYNGYAYCLNNPLKYSDPSGNFIQYIIAGTFFYLQGAYNNRDQATGKWQWNPLKWAGKDSPGFVAGVNINTSFNSTTFYAGVNWNNGMGGANFGYNTGSGFGYGFDPGNPGRCITLKSTIANRNRMQLDLFGGLNKNIRMITILIRFLVHMAIVMEVQLLIIPELIPALKEFKLFLQLY